MESFSPDFYPLTEPRKKSTKRVVIVILVFIAIIAAIVRVAILFYNNQPIRKMDFEYTETNIKRFINGLEKFGNNLEINEIYDIEIDDEDYAEAHVMVRYQDYREAEILLRFERNHREFPRGTATIFVNDNGSGYYKVDDVTSAASVMGIAEAMEMMICDETLVEQHVRKYCFSSDTDISGYVLYNNGVYNGVCRYGFGGEPLSYYACDTYFFVEEP